MRKGWLWSLPPAERLAGWGVGASTVHSRQLGGLSGCACLLSVHDLRQQMTALQSQLRQVQLERTALSSKLQASQAEISSLQSVRQWYQQQLALAQEARVRLQGEMAHIQVWPLVRRMAHSSHLLCDSCFFI